VTSPPPLRPRAPSQQLGGPILHLDVTGSTNDRARALASAGAPSGTVVIAEEQTAGRGRQGRSWLAPRGLALTLSIVFTPDGGLTADALELLPLAVPLAVCECCESVAPVACGIKWPNDVWVAQRKLAGILIESRPQDGWAVIGIGVNVDVSESDLAPELRGSATSLRIEAGDTHPIGREGVLDSLLERVGVRTAHIEEKQRGDLLASYRERDVLRGRRIEWAAGSRRLAGEAQGIDARGNLVVFTDTGERLSLDAGEVHLLA
jgi:BirA family transcriptional regulator, biotin operon repressor / biotin---[acetyl-CoA-carboxylase] ligase